MERERSLLTFKVKGQISRSLGLYKEFWFDYIQVCNFPSCSLDQITGCNIQINSGIGLKDVRILLRNKLNNLPALYCNVVYVTHEVIKLQNIVMTAVPPDNFIKFE